MAPTKLAIFDVDGTLLHSNAADQACFVQAFCDALGFEAIDTNWLAYRHTTDSGITEQVFEERHGIDSADMENTIRQIVIE